MHAMNMYINIDMGSAGTTIIQTSLEWNGEACQGYRGKSPEFMYSVVVVAP